jgi:hypothetical protein
MKDSRQRQVGRRPLRDSVPRRPILLAAAPKKNAVRAPLCRSALWAKVVYVIGTTIHLRAIANRQLRSTRLV